MKYLLLAMLLIACGTEVEQNKKASFDVREACKDGAIVWNPEEIPTWWEAYEIIGQTKKQFPLDYNGGFTIPCNPSTGGTIVVYYN